MNEREKTQKKHELSRRIRIYVLSYLIVYVIAILLFLGAVFEVSFVWSKAGMFLLLILLSWLGIAYMEIDRELEG